MATFGHFPTSCPRVGRSKISLPWHTTAKTFDTIKKSNVLHLSSNSLCATNSIQKWIDNKKKFPKIQFRIVPSIC